MKYNWQRVDWPEFRYDVSQTQDILFTFAEKTGHVSGILKSLPDSTRTEAIIDLMVSEAVKTSEIEGEYLSRSDVMSSIRHNLGLSTIKGQIADQYAKGAADLMVDVRNTYREPLSEKKLFEWHKMILYGPRQVTVGAWRTHAEPMQIISGPAGKLKVHFEATPSEKVAGEMKRFIDWFNKTAPGEKEEIKNPILRSAIAHLYFETIHPFEDGNGRIGRAISEKALSQGLGRPVLLSLSETIEADRKTYYKALKTAQRSNELTSWIVYFSNTVLEAQSRAEESIDFILKKTKFFDQFKEQLNKRQMKVIRRMLDEGPKGFEGGMSAKKYIAITRTSKATATRDLQYLSEIGVLKQTGGGRSIRYHLSVLVL
ncbi:MAG: Fic family protein [Xanthomonadales bacterium]|nr:Fic family protein [Xanthomonadales bacterium]